MEYRVHFSFDGLNGFQRGFEIVTADNVDDARALILDGLRRDGARNADIITVEAVKRFYWFETAFLSLRDELRDFLKENGFYYELSGGSGLWHFEIELSPEQLAVVNAFLDDHTITEKPSNKRTA